MAFLKIFLLFWLPTQNHVNKFDDFSLNLVEFRLLRITKRIYISHFLNLRHSFLVKERSMCGCEQKSR
jgi:hypothetical protein